MLFHYEEHDITSERSEHRYRRERSERHNIACEAPSTGGIHRGGGGDVLPTVALPREVAYNF